MKKKEFIEKLKKELKHLQKDELKEILYDYEEHFRIGKSKKKTEHAIAKSLGDPKTIAKHITANNHVKKAENHQTTQNIIRAIFSTAGLGFFTLIFVLGPFLGVVGALIGLFAASIGIIIAGIAIFITTMASFIGIVDFLGINPLGPFFISIGIVSLGILFVIGSSYLVKILYKITLAYLKFTITFVQGGMKK